MIVVLMGVSGSGKTTIGVLLAQWIGAEFADADDYHSVANKAKMAAGHALDDDDREPWLKTLNGVLLGWYGGAGRGVMACSALKQRYRDTLAAGMPKDTLKFVLLDGSKEMIGARLAARHHEFMNAGLLDSQLATLEAPEEALRVVNDRAPLVVVEEIIGRLQGKGKDV